MKADLNKMILLAVLVFSCCLILTGCSDDKVQDPPGPRIVGDLNETAAISEVVLPEDCDETPGAISVITGRVDNVDLNQVKLVMYSKSGSYYGNIRAFGNDGAFSMDLPCGKRVRLILAASSWTHGASYSSGPPAPSASILAASWDIDRVVGTITGSVSDTYDNSRIGGVAVSCLIEGTAHHDTTDMNGHFEIGGTTIAPGAYTITFSKTDYAELTELTTILTLNELKDDNIPYPGDLEYNRNLEVLMPPLTANLSGQVRRIVPATPDTVVEANVEVQLLLNDNITPNILKDTTDAEGLFSFENVPAADTLSLVVPSFVVSPYTYGPVDTTLQLLPGETVINAVLSASGGGSFRLISDPDRR